MASLLAATLLAAQVTITVGSQDSIRRDSIREARRAEYDSIMEARERRAPRRIPVTAEHLRTAFRDDAARSLLDRVRIARVRHDSSLISYDATAYMRVSVGLGFRRFARDRLLFRQEWVGRVLWHRDQGAWIDVKGARRALPFDDDDELRSELEGDIPIPYYPGRDALWVGREVARREVDDREIVHPLAIGSEAYYRYATGDSVSFELPDGSTIRLRELRVEAREPAWNLVVGSFWFDVASAQLVRAAYRLAIPMDIVEVAAAEDEDDEIPRWLRPMTATVSGITIEYALHRGRWWLPRIQYAEGQAQVSVMRVPFRIEESFKYASVNGIDTLPSFPDVTGTPIADSLALDDSLGRIRRRAVETDEATIVRRRGPGGMRVITRIPRDTIALASSPDLPPSIYSEDTELFSREDARALMKELDFGLQANWNPQPPVLLLPPGSGLARYNRIEGLSLGIGAQQWLGRGYVARGTVRLGVADLEPNGELSLARGSGRDSIELGVYRRLSVANDWVQPFTFGASLSSFLFARDQGLYYRTGGVELRGLREGDGVFFWRLFAERQWRANVETQFSLPNLFNGTKFLPNIIATKGDVFGAGMRYNRTFGLDPRGWRALTDVQVEGAAGDFEFARGMADLTISRGVTETVDGAITLAGGTSVGDVPSQRLWYLGGTQTVRGHQIATMAGDAFWIARTEIGMGGLRGVRPSVFYDVGWAGRAGDFDSPGTPMQGAGVGLSVLDGLLRFDVAKAIRPRDGVRVDFYLEARF
jgi:hypothetical protein